MNTQRAGGRCAEKSSLTQFHTMSVCRTPPAHVTSNELRDTERANILPSDDLTRNKKSRARKDITMRTKKIIHHQKRIPDAHNSEYMMRAKNRLFALHPLLFDFASFC